MVLAILIFLLFAIYIGFAVLSDKVRDKFQFDMLPNEKIQQIEVEATFFGASNNWGKPGILYLTNKRLVFFRHKYGFLRLIPFIGSSLVAVFIDKRIFWEIPVNQIITYQFKPTIYKSNNGTVLKTKGETKFITHNKQTIELDIPLNYTTHAKADLLVSLDNILDSQR